MQNVGYGSTYFLGIPLPQNQKKKKKIKKKISAGNWVIITTEVNNVLKIIIKNTVKINFQKIHLYTRWFQRNNKISNFQKTHFCLAQYAELPTLTGFNMQPCSLFRDQWSHISFNFSISVILKALNIIWL